MKKYIIATIVFLSLLGLSGCGSNSKSDPVNIDPVVPVDQTDPSLPNINGYSFFNATTPLEISVNNKDYEIKVQLLKDGYALPGQIVNMKSFNSTYGSILNSMNVTTDEVGYATFLYHSPDTLPANGSSISLFTDFTDEDNVTIVQEIVLDFNSSGDSVTDLLPLPQVVIPNEKQENNLTINSELIELAIKVFEGETNAPYSEGKVKVELPSKVITGADIGSFEAYEVPIVNGIATFKYTGPNNLQSLVDSGDLSSMFMFYHEENTIDKKSVVMIYDPDPDSGYIPVNYELVVSSQDGNMTMGLEEEKTFSVVLKDDQGNEVSNSSITSMTITSKNTFIAQLLDNGTETGSITISGQNPVNFNVRTNTKSGLLPVDIVVNFVDPNGIAKELKQTINIIVYSGPATAMSISYVGVEQNATNGKYIEQFAVTVVDTYNNMVNTQPNVSVGGMVEYAVDGSSPTGVRNTTSPRLWYGKFNAPYGSIVPIGGYQSRFETPAGGNIFQYVDFNNDKLVIFGEGYVYEALGKWDIQSDTPDRLLLDDDYYGVQRDDLFYAVGHNKRQDLCADDGTEYVGYARSDTYQVNSDGTALVEFAYDYHLTGKDIMLWVNLSGYQADTDTTTRIGEAKKHTLRGNGLITNDSHKVAAGNTTGVPLKFQIRHENAPEWYQNGHFGYSTSGCQVENVLDGSLNYDARSCVNGGIAFVELNVTNPTSSDCTITLTGIAVSDEF